MTMLSSLAGFLLADAEADKRIIIGMLFVGLVFIGVIALGETIHRLRARRRGLH